MIQQSCQQEKTEYVWNTWKYNQCTNPLTGTQLRQVGLQLPLRSPFPATRCPVATFFPQSKTVLVQIKPNSYRNQQRVPHGVIFFWTPFMPRDGGLLSPQSLLGRSWEKAEINAFQKGLPIFLCLFLLDFVFFERGKTNKMKQFKVNANKMANHFRITRGSRKRSLKMLNQVLIPSSFKNFLEKDWFLLPCLKIYSDQTLYPFELCKPLYSVLSWNQNMFI